jgi:hypothetical protein
MFIVRQISGLKEEMREKKQERREDRWKAGLRMENVRTRWKAGERTMWRRGEKKSESCESVVWCRVKRDHWNEGVWGLRRTVPSWCIGEDRHASSARGEPKKEEGRWRTTNRKGYEKRMKKRKKQISKRKRDGTNTDWRVTWITKKCWRLGR